MRWLKGLMFVIIALVSLIVVLLWPHRSYTGVKFENVPANALIPPPPPSHITPRGLPTIWLEEIKEKKDSYSSTSKDSKKYEFDSTNLLINLISWGVFLFFVEISLRGISKRRNK